MKRLLKYPQSTPYIPKSWGTFNIWGTPPDPQHEVSCTSFSAVSLNMRPQNLSVVFDHPPVIVPLPELVFLAYGRQFASPYKSEPIGQL